MKTELQLTPQGEGLRYSLACEGVEVTPQELVEALLDAKRGKKGGWVVTIQRGGQRDCAREILGAHPTELLTEVDHYES